MDSWSTEYKLQWAWNYSLLNGYDLQVTTIVSSEIVKFWAVASKTNIKSYQWNFLFQCSSIYKIYSQTSPVIIKWGSCCEIRLCIVVGGQKQITENILSMPCSSLSSNYPQHLPQTGGQEIAEQAVLWVMAGDWERFWVRYRIWLFRSSKAHIIMC